MSVARLSAAWWIATRSRATCGCLWPMERAAILSALALPPQPIAGAPTLADIRRMNAAHREHLDTVAALLVGLAAVTG